jgi:hypothetical protein
VPAVDDELGPVRPVDPGDLRVPNVELDDAAVVRGETALPVEGVVPVSSGSS